MSKDRPIFVSVETIAFSGATLLAFLLNTHPQIASVGEMNGLISKEDPDEYRCSCGQRIRDCEFWQSVGIAMRAKGFEFDVAHFDMKFALPGPQLVQYLRLGSFQNHTLNSIRDAVFQAWPGERRKMNALTTRNQAFIEAVLEVTGKRVFVDTSKDPIRLRAMRKFSTLDVRAIHLTRDVRGVVGSWLRRGRDADASQVARRWVKGHQRLEAAIATLPEGKRVRLRYEDLCTDVPGTLEQLFRFCGVDPDTTIADFPAAPHHIVGNRMRLENLSEIRLDTRWQSLLNEGQLAEIDLVAGLFSRRYGYH